ncbi:hypothetical protein CERZMDRAFT_89215 [Cercospora zeae-maydis SCOH1-5]|uniref:Carrier domain-containing protein n=1 Tax=Cercospora zeae-maydis SCOH1-5 TaxID=717836 RepID=A0A6A6EZM6_9PEZI|nr:hypothetical protein CERZMDRAFT_89215 [Cercospora zeae-maydis SCOH1-5]
MCTVRMRLCRCRDASFVHSQWFRPTRSSASHRTCSHESWSRCKNLNAVKWPTPMQFTAWIRMSYLASGINDTKAERRLAHVPVRQLPLDDFKRAFEDPIRILQTTWLISLSIYEGNSQVSCLLGPTDGHAELGLLGLSIDKDLAFRELLSRLRRQAFDSDERARADLKSAIFQGSVTEAEECLNQRDGSFADIPIDLVLVIDEIGGTGSEQRAVSLLYDSAVIDEASAVGRSETLYTMLSAILKSSESPVRALSILSDYDKQRIVSWNRPPPEHPIPMTIHAGFATNVRDFPEAPAIYAWDGQMTYRELDIESSKIVSHWERTVAGAGSNMVLFNMKKSKWALVAALAILKAGKAIIPVDPSWPRARLDQIIHLTAGNTALCDPDTASALESYNMNIVTVPLGEDIRPDSAYSKAQAHCSPSDLAFVLFSSGSTGVPKGMLRQHDTACTGSFAHAKAMHLDRNSRVLQFANHVFDVAMLDFFTTLLVGGCVCIPSESDRKNGLAAFVEKSTANWALLTPTVADLLDPVTVPSLKYVTLGGEAIKEATLRKWLKVARVGINYGSAEVDVTHARDVLNGTDLSNVGGRLPSCSAYIVDPENPSAILPVGAVGELTISGSTMAREYLNAPAKTAEVFLPVPEQWVAQGLIEAPQEAWNSRIYRMGDLFRQTSNGSLQFVGRKDFQVKVNGQKVELGEIESKLARHPDVNHCAVLYPAEGPYAKRLVAVVQAQGGPRCKNRHNRAASKTDHGLTFQIVTEYLQPLLPSFMLPSVLIGMENMPFTPTMKIDRTRLKQWLSQDHLSADSLGGITLISTALNGPLLLSGEKSAIQVSRLVADVIAAPGSTIWNSISAHDNRLGDIGINSAQTMRLGAMIQKHFGTKVLFETLSESEMTIRKLAALLDSKFQQGGSDLVRNDLDAKIHFLKNQVTKRTQTILQTTSSLATCSRHIFLTGATGYLGVQILLQLLRSSNIASVTVLVRSSSPDHALEKVRAALIAAEAGAVDESKLRAWSGDLSKPRLGLVGDHWMTLSRGYSSQKSCGPCIDTIIHCGAVVNWTKSYTDLEGANVGSTEELLKVVKTCPQMRRYVFISGGRYPNPLQESHKDTDTLYADAANNTGYAQTKFVAEQLVNNVRSDLPDKSISVVSPAYLVGSWQHGLANQDDYLWRIVWASVRVGAFNADEKDQWLFVAQSDAVAERVLALTLLDFRGHSKTTLNILDGLGVDSFWSIVSEVLAVHLAADSGDVWLQKVRRDMEENDNHLLWPLADNLNSGGGLLTQQQCRTADLGAALNTQHVVRAIRSNIEHLNRNGFFS